MNEKFTNTTNTEKQTGWTKIVLLTDHAEPRLIRHPGNASVATTELSYFDYDVQTAHAAELVRRWNAHDELVEALKAIAGLAGNLSDDVIMSIGGANDGIDRAIKVVAARQIALATLATKQKVE